MKMLVATVAVTAVALSPATAGAHSRAKTYRGTFQLVGADGSYTSDSFGKAQLVDGPRNDQLSVHVRHLGKRATYTFRLLSAPTACEAGAPAGTEVPGWSYRRGGLLVTNRKGSANSFARARGFKVSRDVEYYVGVFNKDDGQIVACAQLTKKRKAPVRGGGKKGDDRRPGRGTGPSPGQGGAGAPGKPDQPHGKSDESHGKSDTSPGKSDESHGKSDESHGKSDQAPGHGGGNPGQGRKAAVSRR